MISDILKEIHNPYYWRRRRAHWFFTVYEIMYDDMVVLELTSSQHQLCKDIVDAMNTAHQVGAIDAWGYIELLKQAS